jgi:predicted nucleic acid-binding protein
VTSGYLIDTSVQMRAHREPVEARLEILGTNRLLYRCAITDLEVLFSAATPADYELTRQDLSASYADLPITTEVMARALEIQRMLATRSQHRGVGLADLIIAACAGVNDATVVHYDADYDLVATVTDQPVEWVVAAGTID